jgi:hypothetical protein
MMPGPSTSRSSVGESIGRPHTRHRRPVPRRIEDIPVAANNSRFDSRARTSCLRSPSGRPGIIASGIVAPQTRRKAPRGRIGESCAESGRSSQMPQVRAPRCANQKARRRHIYSTPAALRKCATAPPLMAREQDGNRETRRRRSALARAVVRARPAVPPSTSCRRRSRPRPS